MQVWRYALDTWRCGDPFARRSNRETWKQRTKMAGYRYDWQFPRSKSSWYVIQVGLHIALEKDTSLRLVVSSRKIKFTYFIIDRPWLQRLLAIIKQYQLELVILTNSYEQAVNHKRSLLTIIIDNNITGGWSVSLQRLWSRPHWQRVPSWSAMSIQQIASMNYSHNEAFLTMSHCNSLSIISIFHHNYITITSMINHYLTIINHYSPYFCWNGKHFFQQLRWGSLNREALGRTEVDYISRGLIRKVHHCSLDSKQQPLIGNLGCLQPLT